MWTVRGVNAGPLLHPLCQALGTRFGRTEWLAKQVSVVAKDRALHRLANKPCIGRMMQHVFPKGLKRIRYHVERRLPQR